MASPDRECIMYFPFGGDEYTQCKEGMSQLSGVVTKKMSKVRTYLEGTPCDLIIVAHGKQSHSVGRTPKMYSEGGFFGHSKKTANTIVTEMRNGLGTQFDSERITRLFLWICYSSISGLGSDVSEALRESGIPVYATPQAIGGVGVWNNRSDPRCKGVGGDSFVRMR